MLFDSVRVFIGHIYGGDIYGEYDNNDGTKLLRPDLNLVLDSKCLGFDCLCRFSIEFYFLVYLGQTRCWFVLLRGWNPQSLIRYMQQAARQDAQLLLIRTQTS